jgi:hypothetical protein
MPRHGILRITWTTIMALEQRRNYGGREDRAKGAVTIDSSSSAALLRQRATCRTTWKSRSGRSKRTRCSRPASRLGAATDAEIAVAPNPASKVARTASLRWQFQRDPQCAGRHAKALYNAASNSDRVPGSAYRAQVGHFIRILQAYDRNRQGSRNWVRSPRRRQRAPAAPFPSAHCPTPRRARWCVGALGRYTA